MKSLIFATLLISILSQPYPNIVFHGLGDSCLFAGMSNFTATIANATNAYTLCVPIGSPNEESPDGVLWPFPKQTEIACNIVQNDPNFNGKVNVIGLSQGGLLARYIIEQCPFNGTVSRYLSIGGPQMGVAKFPNCFQGPFCSILNDGLEDVVYTKFGQEASAPSGYFKDPQRYQEYLDNSLFLPYLNNEKSDKNETYFDNMVNLDAVMLVMFTEDTVIYPRETAWFGYFNSDNELLTMTETELYQDNYIGLQELNEAGKIQFVSIVGNHLQFTYSDILDTFVPFLIDETLFVY